MATLLKNQITLLVVQCTFNSIPSQVDCIHFVVKSNKTPKLAPDFRMIAKKRPNVCQEMDKRHPKIGELMCENDNGHS